MRIGGKTSAAQEVAPSGVVAVIVTHDRPVLLRRCLMAVFTQACVPDQVLVIDNASGAATRNAVLEFPRAEDIRLDVNVGGAGGFCAGMQAALACGAVFMWLMDDDGWPREPDCLARLLAGGAGRDIVAPLVLDEDDPRNLAFPLRIGGRTLFKAEAAQARGAIGGLAHLFNGALIAADLVRRVGLPDPRFFMRGDEVEFLARARRAGARITLLSAVEFMHPGSAQELHPIMGGLYYAVVPRAAAKRTLQFRKRGSIFRHYGQWAHLLADSVRYGWYYLITSRGDFAGLAG